VSLVVLTVGDYVLWTWSIAEGHDIVSLVAGLTLLPLAAVSFGGLLLAGGRLGGLLLSIPPWRARTHAGAHKAGQKEQPMHPSATESSASSSRLAA
jgi:hypothetical protein